MVAAYSSDLRERIIQCCHQDETMRNVAEIFNVSISFVQRGSSDPAVARVYMFNVYWQLSHSHRCHIHCEQPLNLRVELPMQTAVTGIRKMSKVQGYVIRRWRVPSWPSFDAHAMQQNVGGLCTSLADLQIFADSTGAHAVRHYGRSLIFKRNSTGVVISVCARFVSAKQFHCQSTLKHFEDETVLLMWDKLHDRTQWVFRPMKGVGIQFVVPCGWPFIPRIPSLEA